MSIAAVRDVRGALVARERVLTAPVPPGRWLALAAVLLSIAHGRLHHAGEGGTFAAVIAGSGSLLPPTASGGILWGVIQAVLLGVAIAQLGEHQRGGAAYDRVAHLVVVASVAASLLAATGAVGTVGLTAAVALALALVGAVAYARIAREVGAGTVGAWVGLPFALLLAWSAMIAVGAVDGLVAAHAGRAVGSVAAVVLAIAAGAGAARLGRAHRDPVLPAAAAWLLGAGGLASPAAAIVGSVAVMTAAACATVALAIALTDDDRPRPVPRARQG